MVRYDINIYMKTAVRNIVDPPRINLVANDYNGNRFDFTIFHDNRTIFDLTGKRVTLIVKSPSGAVVQDFCEITSATEGKATITLKKSFFQEAGEYYVELQVYEGQNRATSAPFNYTVRKNLDSDEIAITTNELSIVQEAIANVAASGAIANDAKVKAEAAKVIADDLVPKVTQAATDANTALDRALSVVTQEDLAEKITIDDDFVQNVNFIENQIVQDGLHFLVNNQALNTDTVAKTINITDTLLIQMDLTINSLENNGGWILSLDNKSLSYAGEIQISSNKVFVFWGQGFSSSNTLVKGNNTITIKFTTDSVEIILNGIVTKFSTSRTVDFGRMIIGKKTGKAIIDGYGNFVVYSKSLTPTEIAHNLSILKNTPSINKINGYTISTDTDHIQDRTGRVQDTINRVFYRNMCKEFTSDGSPIAVNNGMDGYVLSGKIEGQTVKNYFLKENSYNVRAVFVSDGNMDNNKTYDLVVFVSGLSGSESAGQYTLLDNAGSTISTIRYTFTNGKNIVKIKTTQNCKIGVLSSSLDTLSLSKIEFACLVDDNNGLYINSKIPTGLSSTQALISNNGLKYSFYKDSVDKASDTVLTLGGVGVAYDTLEIKEDGSGIYTQNTKEMVLNGSENWGIHASIPNLFFTIYDTALNMKATDSIMMVSDKYTATTYYPTSNNSISGGGASNPNRFAIKDESCATASDLKSKLASNNVTVRYQLATPIVATIPKEIMPTVLTQLQTQIVFGDAVKPSSVMIKIPTTDDVSKSYTQTLLNGYIQTVGTATPIVNLLNNGIVRLQMDLTAPTTLLNATIFAVAPELRPLTSAKIPIFVNGVCVLGTVDKTTGNVNLPSVPSASANIYIKTDYRRDI